MPEMSQQEHKEYLSRLKGRVADLELIVTGIKNELQAITDFIDQVGATPSDE